MDTEFSRNLEDNIATLREIYADCSDVIFHDFQLLGGRSAMLVYIDGLSNTELFDRNVLAPLQSNEIDPDASMQSIKNRIVVSSVNQIKTLDEAITSITSGRPVLIIDRMSETLSLGLEQWEKRSIDEPSTETIIRGPHEGFIETIGVNMALIRRRIKSPKLKTKALLIGEYTKTQVVVSYIEGIAAPDLVEEVINRIRRIKIDGILESAYIEQLIEDVPSSPFPQVLTTERPDIVTSNLLEGRVAILTDGTPVVIIVPISFFSLLHSPEDYYDRAFVGTAIRWLRYVFFAVSLIAPSFYIAVATYHQEMIPTALLFSIAKAREEVPFPALIEALMMEITFEALREAGVRLPKQIGSAVSIVGALVIGQAATAAGLVSAPMVIVVALTGIASFMSPHYSLGISARLLRFPLMLLAGFLGLLGLILGMIAIIVHLCGLRSFGMPYLSPIAPLIKQDLKDVLERAPVWAMDERPHLTNAGKVKRVRQSPGMKPKPPKGDDRA